jgi:hypothetical protein
VQSGVGAVSRSNTVTWFGFPRVNSTRRCNNNTF